jgi:Icc-related predicted phosphoesterase
VKLFFATDVHGSETCWRKFLNSAEFYGADVLVLGGDMTGKALVPLIQGSDGRYRTYLQDQRHDFEGDDELARYERIIRERGYYPIRLTEEQLAEYEREPERLDDRFDAEMRAVLERWVALADERLAGRGIRCVVCPGNDDRMDIDAVLREATGLELGEGRVIDLPEGYQLVSTGWSNRTPWDTHREEDEPDLQRRIETAAAQATVPPERLVLNLHCPPYDTPLDLAPKLTEDLMVEGQEMVHVGSTAVRTVIEELQPGVSLHGHIHESRAATRLGRTLAINPGSSYEQGVLHGSLVNLDGKAKVKRYKLTTG